MTRGKRRKDVRAHDDVLGYLVKHAHLALERQTDAALEPFGLTSRDLGVLRVIAAGEVTSQQDVAAVLGIDRTSMVAFIDQLEDRELVFRAPSERDRRRNVLGLTDSGRAVFENAEAASIAAERTFTAGLGTTGATELRRLLRVAVQDDATSRSADVVR